MRRSAAVLPSELIVSIKQPTFSFSRKKLLPLLAGAVVLFAAIACSTRPDPILVFKESAEPFVYSSLALSPVSATALGYHEHVEGGEGGTTIGLDELLDDYSPAGVAKRINLCKEHLAKLAEGQTTKNDLMGEEFVSFGSIEYYVEQTLLELEKIRSHEHNPNLYVELVGTALYTPLVHEYASKPERYGHVIARLQKVPAFLDQAKQNLQSSPAVWTEVAQQANSAVIKLVEEVIPASLPTELKGDYDSAAAATLTSLRDFGAYLKDDLANRNDYDWRLSKQLYTAKFKAAMGRDHTPEQVLADAEAEFEKVRGDAISVGEALDKSIFGSARPPSDKLALMKGVLEVVSDENRLRTGDWQKMADRIKSDIEELRQFVNDSNLIPLPSSDNLQIVETPEFMRGVYSVAGFMPAPPLTPKLGAFYWVTPIPADWPRLRVTSKLREYNYFQLKLLSLHEAMPGHYVQFELSSQGHVDLNPFHRTLRSAFPNGPYVEGWATYATEAIVNSGYQSKSNEFQINWQKLKLRVLANAILDIRMHTMNMSDEEAMDLMVNQAFQETEEARGKLLRAKLTSAQLPQYYVGWKDWLKVRNHYQTETNDFSLSSFHDKTLRAGPAPLRDLGYLIANLRAMAD